jgi:hypothetical protein
MNPNTSQLPKALVLRWNIQTLQARCPFCLYSHTHGYAGPLRGETVDPTKPGWKLRLHGTRRRSDCADVDEGGDYTFVFPDTSDPVAKGYGWEVNDGSSGFVAVDNGGMVVVPINDWIDGRTLLPQYQNQPLDSADFDDAGAEMSSLADAANGLNLEDSTGEEDPYKTGDPVWDEMFSEPAWRQKFYMTCCAEMNISQLEMLHRRYPNDNFVGCVDYEGDNGSLLAASDENGLEQLRWHHGRGASITHANRYGRTPLMEAALWGRLEAVQYLASQIIDLDVRDGNEMRAVDLAANTARNTKEKTERLRFGNYREAPDADRRRRQIEELLKRLTPSPSETSASTSSNPQGTACFNRNHDGTIEVYRPQMLLQPPLGRDGRLQTQKAFATLDRGPNYPFINAMSGYSHAGWTNVLDNSVWTDKADSLRASLGLQRDIAAAAHVEPQLLAYLLDRHSLHTLTDFTERRRLLEVMPTYSLRAVITVSKLRFCHSCREMIGLFKERLPELGVALHCVGESAVTPLQSL